jgi:subtilisin family serine protease
MKITSLLYILAVVGLSTAAVIHTPPSTVDPKDIKANTYFAVFKSEAGTPDAQKDHERFQEQIKALGIQITPRQQFTELLNAASFEMDDADLQRVANIDAVKEIFPMLTHAPPRVIKQDVQDPLLKYAHGITGVKEVHQTLGLTGKGIKVGIIDTGIDYLHPALGEGFGKGFRVAYGHDFVGDDYDENTNPKPKPDDDPMDCGGHGTHVAGIVGAKDKDFVGVAPEVTFGAYRLFGCKGSTGTDIIIAALERAYKDGMDIVNLSLGGGSSWAGYPTSVVADKLAAKGMVVVAAMGNDGDKVTLTW